MRNASGSPETLIIVYLSNNHIKLLLLSAMLLVFPLVQAQTHVYALRELQAAYIYNFAKYIKWPAEAEAFVIGVYAED
jgi:hypothetical protein